MDRETKQANAPLVGETFDVSGLTIDFERFGDEVVDVMRGCGRWTIKVHDLGEVSMVDCMPRFVKKGTTGDSAIVQAARVSYGAGTTTHSKDRALIRYLCRHRHTTPLEMVEFKFHCVMPIFIARQWIRHRTANVNEYSARYSILPDKFYRPIREYIKIQDANKKQAPSEQGADDLTAQQFLDYLEKQESGYAEYKELLDKGLSREQARMGLPINMYTEWYWKCDLHNILRFLGLRMEKHAQQEIRDYANAMYRLVAEVCPYACEAFVDFQLEGMYLSKLEIEAIAGKHENLEEGASKGEQDEWRSKRTKLGIQ